MMTTPNVASKCRLLVDGTTFGGNRTGNLYLVTSPGGPVRVWARTQGEAIRRASNVSPGDRVRWDGDMANEPQTFVVLVNANGWLTLSDGKRSRPTPFAVLGSPRWSLCLGAA